LATACSLLVASVTCHEAGVRYEPLSIREVCNEPALATYLDGHEHSPMNGLWRTSFGWTNHSQSPSSNAAFSLHSTNDSKL
jgi:hypothetical protein